MSTALFRPNSKIRAHEGLNLETVNDRTANTGMLRFGYTSCNADSRSVFSSLIFKMQACEILGFKCDFSLCF